MRFIALDVSLGLIGDLRVPLARLRRLDPDLHRQIRRAASSVALNLSEGAERAGKNRQHLFRVARGSAREVETALRVAQSWGDLKHDDVARALKTLDRLLALLGGLTR